MTANSTSAVRAAATSEARRPVSRPEIVALVAVLLLAAGLRFGWLGVSSFAWDEARISLDALRMARGGELVLAGQPSSVDVPFFPLSVWAFVPPFLASPDPLVAVIYVSALSLLTVVGVWVVARDFGAGAGITAALFMAASPYAVLYGRSIWQPNLLPVLGVGWLLCARLSLRSGGRGAWLGAAGVGLIGAAAVQVHFAGVALALASGYMLLRHYLRRPFARLIAFCAGGALALTAMLPYLYYITAVDPRVLERLGGLVGTGESVIDLSGLGNLVRLALGWEWGFLGLGDRDPHGTTIVTALIAGGLALTGVIALARRAWHGDRLAEAVLIALIVSPLFFLRHSSPVLIHYALIALPAAAIAVGAAARLMRGRAWAIAACGAAVILASVWTSQIADTLARASVERPPNSALSSILNESRDAARAAADPILFFTHGDDPALHGEAAVFRALLWERPHRILNGETLLILPSSPATLMATLAPFQMWEELEAGGLAEEMRAHPRRAGALPFVSTAYDGQTLPDGFIPIDPLALADDTTLIGWRWRMVGERLRISTLWRVDGDALPGTVQAFHHLRRADSPADSPPDHVSDVPLSRATWRAGDHVVVMADFFGIAPGTTWTIDTGRYTLEDGARIPARPPERAPGASIRLGTFTR